MSRKLFSSDVKFEKAANSSWDRRLMSGKVGSAANLFGEKKHLYEYFKKSYKESGGNTTVAIAKTMGYIRKDPQFSTQERLQIKSGLKKEGYFVPDYVIMPKEERLAKDSRSAPGLSREKMPEKKISQNSAFSRPGPAVGTRVASILRRRSGI